MALKVPILGAYGDDPLLEVISMGRLKDQNNKAPKKKENNESVKRGGGTDRSRKKNVHQKRGE